MRREEGDNASYFRGPHFWHITSTDDIDIEKLDVSLLVCESWHLIMLLPLIKHSCLPWEFHFLASSYCFSLSSISIFFSAFFSVLNFPQMDLFFVLWMYLMRVTLVFAVPIAKYYSLRSIFSVILLPYSTLLLFLPYLWDQELSFCT